mmetsp:Transcript_28123/g.72767  ORF Transcript_28123/g.72767 Transcript_28123/m.72767 type:complete len:222 (-) Transcript_28123:218-883(-)
MRRIKQLLRPRPVLLVQPATTVVILRVQPLPLVSEGAGRHAARPRRRRGHTRGVDAAELASRGPPAIHCIFRVVGIRGLPRSSPGLQANGLQPLLSSALCEPLALLQRRHALQVPPLQLPPPLRRPRRPLRRALGLLLGHLLVRGPLLIRAQLLPLLHGLLRRQSLRLDKIDLLRLQVLLPGLSKHHPQLILVHLLRPAHLLQQLLVPLHADALPALLGLQ